jgi:transposase
MFARVKRIKTKAGKICEYLVLVENKRINGKVRQRVIANLGRTELLRETNMADLLVDKLKAYTRTSRLMELADTSCDWTKDYGIMLILRRLWQETDLEDIFKHYLNKYKYRSNLAEAILALIASRLVSVGSELHTAKWVSRVYQSQWENLKAHTFYRALDFIYHHKKDIQKEIFFKATDLFNQKLDLVMFDTTSIKYWGEGKDIDLLQYGYSKEKRGDLKQLIVGVLMTKEGIPCACEIFAGNTSDIKSFVQVLEKLKEDYDIGRLIWVADRGMVSQANIDKLKELKQDYILGVKMRQFNKEKRNKLLSLDKMMPVRDDLYVKEVNIEGEGRYIICYNPQEAEWEFNKRQYFRRHIKTKLKNSTTKEWIIKNGYKKYIDFEGELTLNEKKLYAENQFDGKWVLLTNTNLPSQEAALYYKGLWQIEAGFRELKQDLETSPIYHWTERRIIAHVFVSFLALLLKITLKKKIRQIDKEASYQEVFEAIHQIKAVKLTEGRKEIIFRSEFPDKANLAFKAVGIAPPARILAYQETQSVVSKSQNT